MDTEMLWERVRENRFLNRGAKYRLHILLIVAIVLLLVIILAVCRSPSPPEINHQDNSILNSEVIVLSTSTEGTNTNTSTNKDNSILNSEVITESTNTSANVVDDYNQTYVIRYAIHKLKKFPVTNFTCMEQNTQDLCPVYMEVFNEIYLAELVHFINGNKYKLLISNYGSIQLTFQNNTVRFKSREKLYHFMFGWVKGLNNSVAKESEESVLGSIDFNWDRKIDFNLSETINVMDSKYMCSNSNFNKSAYLISCPESERFSKQFTSWIRAVFGLESLNATWTVGKALNWPRVTSELSLIGRTQKGWTPQDVQQNIILFDKQQKEWCKCMKPLRFIQKADNRGTCFQNLAIRREFQMQFDYKICERAIVHE